MSESVGIAAETLRGLAEQEEEAAAQFAKSAESHRALANMNANRALDSEVRAQSYREAADQLESRVQA